MEGKKLGKDEDEEPVVEESVEQENSRKRLVLTERARNSRLGREMFAYCIYLILFTVVTVLPNDDPNLEGLNYATTRLFLQEDNLLFNTNKSFVGPKFIDIGSVDDIWQWLRGPFLHAAYMSDWFTGNPWSVGDQGLVAGSNLIIGTINIRQKRVRSASCVIPSQFMGSDKLNDCVADYHPSVEDTSLYGPFYTEPEWAGAFAFNPAWPAFSGGMRYYSNGAFALELPAAACSKGKVKVPCIAKADSMLQDLASTGWIDVRTRAVIAEVTLYSPSVNAFVVVQGVIELPSTGAVSPYPNVRTARLIRYGRTEDLAVLGAEVTLVLLGLLDVLDKVVFFRTFRASIWRQWWDLGDVALHVLFAILMALRLNVAVRMDGLRLDPAVRAYYDVPGVLYWHDQAEGLAAFLAAAVWLRAYKYLWQLSWTRRILETLRAAAAPLLGLALAGLVALLGFAHAGLLAFGTQVHELRGFGVALMSCYRFIFSGMPLEELQQAQGFLGPLYYVAFKACMVLVLVRFFVAVLVDAYHEVMVEHRHRWPLSCPPLEALAQDVLDWWNSAGPPDDDPSAAGGPAQPATLSGATAKQVADKEEAERGRLGEMEGPDMYRLLKAQVAAMQAHVDARLGNLEGMFLSSVAPLVETMDLLIKQQTEHAALAAVRAVKKG